MSRPWIIKEKNGKVWVCTPKMAMHKFKVMHNLPAKIHERWCVLKLSPPNSAIDGIGARHDYEPEDAVYTAEEFKGFGFQPEAVSVYYISTEGI